MKYRDLQSKKRYSRQYVIPSLEENGYYDRAEKIEKCSMYIKTATCDSCYTTHFDGSYSCHDRLCPVCAKKRTLAWSIKLIPILIDLLKHGYHLNMLTFTIRTNKDMPLKQAINRLYDSWRYMTNTCKTSRKVFNGLVLGGIRSLEVKMGEMENSEGEIEETGCWHPHFHVLVCTHGTVPYKELHRQLFEMWNHSLSIISGKDLSSSLGTVNIRSIKCQNETALLKSILEVFKYITKFNWQTDNVKELVDSLNGVRGITSFGNFRYFLHEAEIEKLMNKSMTELEEQVCVVCGNTSFISADMYDTGNLIIQDFDNRQFAFLTALSKFNEID